MKPTVKNTHAQTGTKTKHRLFEGGGPGHEDGVGGPDGARVPREGGEEEAGHQRPGHAPMVIRHFMMDRDRYTTNVDNG